MVKGIESHQNITTVGAMKPHHMEFEQIRDYCCSLSEKLNTIDKISRRIYKERQGKIFYSYY